MYDPSNTGISRVGLTIIRYLPLKIAMTNFNKLEPIYVWTFNFTKMILIVGSKIVQRTFFSNDLQN